MQFKHLLLYILNLRTDLLSIEANKSILIVNLCMKYLIKSVGLLSLLFASNLAFSQISFNKSSILFNATNEISKDSSSITIKNIGTEPISIDTLIFFKTLKSNAFTTKFSSTSLNANDSVEIKIYFAPKHNIFHNSEVLIVTNPSAYSVSIDLKGQGKYSKTYYNLTENKSEDDLKAALKSIVTAGYVSLGYNSARDKMFMEFDNQSVNGQGASVNTLECVYTGRKTVGYTSRTDAQSTTDPSKNFNTEHTFPQGFFSQNEPMRSDLHHLFPTDNSANNSRGSYPFGIATTPYKNDAINFPSHLGSNNLYEPRDAQKGRTARAMMYFVIRYLDYADHFAPQESILRTWHTQFPPNAVDLKRNDDIASVQKNRNPFVDYPQFDERITKIIGTSTTAIVPSIYKLDSIQLFSLNDTTDSVIIYVPIVNTGNKRVVLSNGISTNDLVKFNFDTLGINISESALMPLTIHTKDTSGIFEANIQFNTDFSFVQYNFNLRFVVDKVEVGQSSTKKTDLKVYPNPFNNYLFVQSANKDSYQIFNSLSQIVSTGEINSGINKIDIENLEKGVYYLRTSNSTHKIFKQ